MLVSIVIPAYRAQATLVRAVKSALSQSQENIEVIVVADDQIAYDVLLRKAGINDERLRFTSTARTASGCHNARNVGLTHARGDFIAALDADDIYYPTRLEILLPLAIANGAANDNPAVVSDATSEPLYRAFDRAVERERLDAASLLDLSVPLFPLVARPYAEPRLAGIELGEDFVANLRLIDRLGSLTVCSQTLSEYRVVTGSLAHNDTSADGFEASYTAMIERLERGDRLGLSPTTAAVARERLIEKREFNRAFATARAADPTLNFQTFAARRR